MNTIFVGTFRYQDKEFILRFNFEIKDYPEDAAIWMFTEGNYSCDCNRSLFIRRQFGEDAIPELPCGDTIKLLNYYIEHKPYEEPVKYNECFFMHNKC
jgi:hypothetical protein